MNNSFKILLINRDVDIKRKEQFYSSAPTDCEIEHISAVDAYSETMNWEQYSHYNRNNFWGDHVFKPGVFACFLSHAKAWKRLVESSDEYALICEDDAIFFDGSTVDTLQTQYVAGGYDILFVNERLSTWIINKDESSTIHDLNNCIQDIIKNDIRLSFSGEGVRASPGGDGYVINKHAAIKLLELMEKTGIECGVDWFLVAAAIDGKKMDSVPSSRYGIFSTYGAFRFISEYFYKKDELLKGGILTTPFVKESPIDVGGSTIKHGIEASFEVFA